VDGQSSLIYATYLGGADNESGLAIAVDTSSNAYITGSTFSNAWPNTTSSFQPTGYGGAGDAFIAKIGTQSGSTYPLTYFTYLGGSGADVGNAILVDSSGAVHVVWQHHIHDQLPHNRAPTVLHPSRRRLRGADSNLGNGRRQLRDLFGGQPVGSGHCSRTRHLQRTYVAGTTVSTDFPTSPTPYRRPTREL